MTLDGQIALVTGASRGIGRAIAEAMAAAGADVAINFRSHPDEAEQVAQRVRQLGRRATLCPGDVSDRSAIEKIIARTVAELGALNIAVANAAFSRRQPFYEADLDDFERTIDVTMWGAFNIFWAAARQMISQGQGGSIVGVSSPHAFVPVPASMAYNIAKAAVDQMARTAAVELAAHRIRVNLVHPGWTDTPGERRFFTEEQIAQSGPRLPWGRLGRPDEIARAVVFFCDPASDYITGSSLLVDGGLSLASRQLTQI